ncbi:hypothetical protein Bca52824_001264 [Brassica carinata]|uniref:Uncharacterized protein n=1 Tax=Brassica carinata TaxID=52824 RepID=A0A8X8B9M0_BRACI|nr:hypothetical protein Bca52824_001264 [Brassica carinata]
MASAVCHSPLLIWRVRFVPAHSQYGECGSSRPTRHMASEVRPVPLTIWRVRSIPASPSNQ